MSFAEYQAHGWALCRIEPGKKAPLADDWNEPENALSQQDCLDIEEIGCGAGLMHALSGTCALDIDNLDLARPFLAEHGVDVDALLNAPEAVKIMSGRAGRAKLLYRMKLPMRTLKPKDSGIELRSATSQGKSVQDVLPPTIHPDTKKPYAWVYGDKMLGHWSNPPPIPSTLLALWRSLASAVPLNPQQSPRTDVTIDTVRKAMYQKIKREKLDVGNHDDWLKIGMALHDQTGGAQEGLELWDQWSATDDSTRDDGSPRYQGMDALKVRWVSFSSGTGKNVVTLQADVAQVPADKAEFEVEPEVDDEESTAAKLKAQAELKKAEAQALLEKRLVFVRNLEKYFDTERHRIILTESGLRHQFQPMMPRRSRGKLDPVELLRDSTTKRFVDGLGFHPGQGPTFKSKGDTYANAYRNRLPEPLEPTTSELEKIDWLFGRIADVPYREWLVQFYAHVVQYPGVKIKSAPLIWSDIQGNGKTTLTKVIPALLVGEEYSQDVTSGLLESPHNDYLTGKWHIYLDEFRAGSRGERQAISKKVEVWIANDTVAMNPKGLPGYTTPNHFFVTASSNDDDAASISNQDRKWAILEFLAKQMTPREVSWLYHEFLLTPRAGGVLRHYFMNQPILDFVASASAPKTESRKEMIEASIATDLEALMMAYEERSGIFARDVVVIGEAMTYIHKHTPARPNAHRVGKILARAPFNGTCKRIRVGQNLYRVAILKNHAKWANASGKDIMGHIEGLDDDASVDHVPTDEELLA
jgi:hypothetical protein